MKEYERHSSRVSQQQALYLYFESALFGSLAEASVRKRLTRDFSQSLYVNAWIVSYTSLPAEPY